MKHWIAMATTVATLLLMGCSQSKPHVQTHCGCHYAVPVMGAVVMQPVMTRCHQGHSQGMGYIPYH